MVLKTLVPLALVLQPPLEPDRHFLGCVPAPDGVEPDMRWWVSDFTYEAFRASSDDLRTGDWIDDPEGRVEARSEGGYRWEGDAWLAYRNRLVSMTGYGLKMRFHAATDPASREAAREDFCAFLDRTPIYD